MNSFEDRIEAAAKGLSDMGWSEATMIRYTKAIVAAFLAGDTVYVRNRYTENGRWVTDFSPLQPKVDLSHGGFGSLHAYEDALDESLQAKGNT